MTVGRYLVAIIAAGVEAFGVFSLWVSFFYLWRDYKYFGMPNHREAGLGTAWALSHAIPCLAIAALLYWKIWPSLKSGKLLGRRLPMAICICVLFGMSVWYLILY
jgi:hypothetical protein